MQELRKTDILISKLNGIMSTALIEIKNEKKELHVHTNDNFERRTGSKLIGGEEEPESHSEKIAEDLDYEFEDIPERRSGSKL